MDLSNTLADVLSYLIDIPNRDSSAWVNYPSEFFGHQYNINLYSVIDDYECRSSAVSTTWYSAFLKAVAEIGEDYIVQERGISSGSGIAGGLFWKETITRAKAELIERDAFLWHYRNRIPFVCKTYFNFRLTSQRLLAFTMISSVPDVFCSLVTDESCAAGTNECLIFGIGASTSRQEATTKAAREYACLKNNHLKNDIWCKEWPVADRDKISPQDFHHAASHDPRNVQIFKQLCTAAKADYVRTTSPTDWEITKLKSPIKYFRYAKASNVTLQNLNFLDTEPGSNSTDQPLYHPFW